MIGALFGLLGKTLGLVFIDIWREAKEYLFLIVFITLLMVGIATKRYLLVVLSVLCVIITLGSLRSDRGIKDTTYSIKGKEVSAKTFLKKKVKGFREKVEVSRMFGFREKVALTLAVIGLMLLYWGVRYMDDSIGIGIVASILGFVFKLIISIFLLMK